MFNCLYSKMGCTFKSKDCANTQEQYEPLRQFKIQVHPDNIS